MNYMLSRTCNENVDLGVKHQFKQTNFSKEASVNYMLSRTCNENALKHNWSIKWGSY